MNIDARTLAFYDGAAAQYAGKFGRSTPDQDLRAFMDAVRPGGRILDLGCGPGNSTAIMRDAGFRAEASDASPAMARLAQEKYGVEVRVEDFGALDVAGIFHGIWANFSLLHAPRSEFDNHLLAIHRALVTGGIFHIGLKVGEGERRDDLGRRYTYYSEADLKERLERAGFTITSSRLGEAKGMAGSLDAFIIVLAHA